MSESYQEECLGLVLALVGFDELEEGGHERLRLLVHELVEQRLSYRGSSDSSLPLL